MNSNQAAVPRIRNTMSMLLMIVFLGAASSPAFAQISRVNTVMSSLQGLLIGVAITIFSIAIMWAGFKMAFQHSKWSEVSNIVIGGVLVGGAGGIAGWLIG